MQAPAGYVAGLGRGASGFTTRSDIGPAREGPSAETVAAARARRGEDEGEDDDDPERFQDPEEETGLFATAVYEKDDEEADRIWDSVDRHMDERRRKQREIREAVEREAIRQSQPKIQAQFADLKRNLASVSESEWASLPEPGNMTGKRRKAASLRESRDNRTYAMPDSMLASARDRNQIQNTAADVDGTVSSLTEIGEARNKVFSHQLDQVSTQSQMASSGTSSTIDPTGYLTELSSVHVKSDVEIGDIKKARSLLDSVIKTNPKHAPGWIAAARMSCSQRCWNGVLNNVLRPSLSGSCTRMTVGVLAMCQEHVRFLRVRSMRTSAQSRFHLLLRHLNRIWAICMQLPSC